MISNPTPAALDLLPRLWVRESLAAGAVVPATDAQGHYLIHVMRRAHGDEVALFNGRDGEWGATLALGSKKKVTFIVAKLRRVQDTAPDVWLIFAPLKAARLEMLVEKATELGVSALKPVLTQRTVVRRVNVRRLESIAMEASEQCERLSVPAVDDARPLVEILDQVASDSGARRRLFFLDEGAARTKDAPPLALALSAAQGPAALLVGPEGGFTPEEQHHIRRLPFVSPMILGPRLLRAETAAIAALACWQALAGDWK